MSRRVDLRPQAPQSSKELATGFPRFVAIKLLGVDVLDFCAVDYAGKKVISAQREIDFVRLRHENVVMVRVVIRIH